jgi:hypothetical protein
MPGLSFTSCAIKDYVSPGTSPSSFIQKALHQPDRQPGLALPLNLDTRHWEGQPVAWGIFLVWILGLSNRGQRIQNAVQLHR